MPPRKGVAIITSESQPQTKKGTQDHSNELDAPDVQEVPELTKSVCESLQSFIQHIVDERLAKMQTGVMRFASVRAAALRYGRTEKAIHRLIEKGTIPVVHLPGDSKPQIDVQVVDSLYLPFD